MRIVMRGNGWKTYKYKGAEIIRYDKPSIDGQVVVTDIGGTRTATLKNLVQARKWINEGYPRSFFPSL